MTLTGKQYSDIIKQKESEDRMSKLNKYSVKHATDDYSKDATGTDKRPGLLQRLKELIRSLEETI